MAIRASSKVRLKEVAEAAAVSLSTVSLALADNPRIPAGTRQRIREIAHRLGYQPDRAAQALRQLRHGNEGGVLGSFAMIAPAYILQNKSNLHVKKWLERYRLEGRSSGYALEVFPSPRDAAGALALDRMLYHRGIEGLVLAVGNKVPDWELEWSRYAVVASSWPESCPFHSVGGDRFFDLLAITPRLLALGYRRMGLITPGFGFEGWVGGIEAAHLAAGLPHKVPNLIMDAWDFPKALAWYRRYRPDVIVANHGLALIEDFSSAGIRIPEDVGYCTPDLVEDAPGVAGLVQPRAEVARLAIDLLHSQVRRNDRGRPVKPVAFTIKPDWADGFTLQQQSASTPVRNR